MNIALLVEVPFPPISRANLRLYRLGLVLDRRGHEVYMLSPSFYPHRQVEDSVSGIHAVQYLGFAAFIYSTFIRLPIVVVHLINSLVAIIKLNKKVNLQVIQAWHPLASLTAVVAGKLTGAKVFLDWTDFYSDIVRYESSLIVPIAQAIEHIIMNNCDGIFTVTNEMRKALIKVGASSGKVFVIPDGVDSAMFNSTIDSQMIRKRFCLNDSPTVIFHGDVKPIDGVDVLIKAFALVLKSLPSAKLFVVGGGRKYFSEVKQLVKELGIERSVIFTGWVSHKAVPEYIALADVGAMPLRSTLETNCYLSFKLFEYWAMGKPVVVSRVKAISNVVQDGVNSSLVDPGDVAGFAEALLKILSNRDKAKLMGEKARLMVETFYDWDKIMAREAESVEYLYSS